MSRGRPPHPFGLSLSKACSSVLLRSMTFWTYMLHCAGGAFYVGHTDDLDRRIGLHHTGDGSEFTRDKLPVTLVWSQDFPSRIEALEALEAERRIKGWGRAKKMALIRSDWKAISLLAKSRTGLRQAQAEREG